MNKEKLYSIGLLVLIVAGAVLYGIFGTKKGEKVAQTPKVDPTVATVNGVPIFESVFDAQVAQATSTLKAQGQDVDSSDKLTAIKTNVLTALINNELVSEEIAKANITATDAQVETEHQALITQLGGQDKLNAQLAAANMTDATLRANIAKQLAIQTYLHNAIASTAVNVSDAEIKKFYDDNTKGQTNPPKLKDVSAQIKQQILTNKQQQLVNDFLAGLRAKAQIQTLVKL